MSDVVYVSEGYVTSDTDNEIPADLTTVEEIVKYWSRPKVYHVCYKRTLPWWLQSDEYESDSEPSAKVSKKSKNEQIEKEKTVSTKKTGKPKDTQSGDAQNVSGKSKAS